MRIWMVPALLMATVLMPASAEDVACDNRDHFERLLNDILEATADAGGPVSRADLAPADQETFDDAVTRLSAQAGDVCLDEVVMGAEEDGEFPAASTHYMLYEFFVHEDDFLCNQGSYVGNGGHYEAAHVIPEPLAGHQPWSDGRTEYAGLARSDLSSRDDAFQLYPPYAYYVDLETGKSFAYEQEIVYGGVSDFYCDSFEIWFIHVYAHFNFPVGTGIVAPAGS